MNSVVVGRLVIWNSLALIIFIVKFCLSETEAVLTTSFQTAPLPVDVRTVIHQDIRLSRNEFVSTDTELNAIAIPAKTGLSITPKNGKNNPAASGIPMTL